MDKQKMIEDLEQELYLKEKGHLSAIEVFPGGSKDGLDYGPVLVEIVVLDNDGDTIAYRVSTDSQDDEWEIGHIEEAVDEAIEYREAMEDVGRHQAEEEAAQQAWAQAVA